MSNGDRSEVCALLEQARVINSGEVAGIQLEEKISNYVDRFGEWISNITPEIAATFNDEQKLDLKTLLSEHSQVIKTAESQKLEISEELRTMKSKERAIITYLGGNVRPDPITRPKKL